MNAVEVPYGLIDSLDKLPMPTIAKLVNRVACLGLKHESISIAGLYM